MSMQGKMLTHEYVKGIIEDGSKRKLLTETYKNNRQKLKVICECGDVFEVTFNSFRKGKKRCNACNGVIRYTYEDVKKVVDKSECELISETYVGVDRKLLFRYKCGNEFKTTFSKFRGENKKQCNECGIKNMTGKNNPYYNHESTEEYRLSRRRSKKDERFRKSVFERDNYTCILCKIHGVKLNAHHLNGYNRFPNERYDLNNGVTLCAECHDCFHEEYGYGNNDKEQFKEFKRNHKRLQHA